MKAHLSIVAGLLAGVAVAGLLLGGLVALAPDPPPLATPSPPLAVATASPSSVASTPPSTSPSAAASAATGSFHIGQPAPPLVVPQVGGGTIDLAKLKGKPVWINFISTRCSACQADFPLMNGFAAQYADSDLVVVAIDVKEDEGAVVAFADAQKATFPIGLDADGKVADSWDALALPVHFWIDADGVVRDGAQGGIGSDVMAKGLEAILPGDDVTP
jgi:thiol-disulfide isomerase/thioredoxin